MARQLCRPEHLPAARYRALLISFLVVAAIGLVVDQLGKGWAFGAWGAPHGVRAVAPGVVAGVLGRNDGALFSVEGHGSRLIRWGLTLTGSVAMAVVLWWALVLDRDRWRMVDTVGGGLLLAGALGNLVDRLALGYSRDYLILSIRPHQIFNTADVFMVVGAVVLLGSLATCRRLAPASPA